MCRFPFGLFFRPRKTTKTNTPKSSIVETSTPKKVAKIVPKRSRFSIPQILWILKPLSIHSSVFEGPRDSFFSLLFMICSDSVLGPPFFMFLVSKVTFGSPKSDLGWGQDGGGETEQGTFVRKGPKAAQRRSREASRAAKGSQNGQKIDPKS